MDPTNLPSPSQKKPNQLQGIRPSALKINYDSHKIKKPPLPPQRLNPYKSQIQQPVIIYAVSPKVIHTEVSEFMSVVQRLTGLSSSDFTNDGSLSPAARLAATERFNPQRPTTSSAPTKQEEFDLLEGMDLGQLPGILSPAPSMLPPVPSGFFSPSDPGAVKLLSEFVLSPCDRAAGNGGSFIVSPSGLVNATPGRFSPLASPDFSNFQMDFFMDI